MRTESVRIVQELMTGIKKIIPGNVQNCSETTTLTRDQIAVDETNIALPSDSAQVISNKKSGNKCGHNPKMLGKYLIRSCQKNPYPPLNQMIMNELINAYYFPRKYKNFLVTINRKLKKLCRQKRSERAEASVLALHAMSQFMDRETLEVGGYYEDEKTKEIRFRAASFKQLLELCPTLSKSRFKRACTDLVKMGLLKKESRPPKRNKFGHWTSLPTIYTITTALLNALHFSNEEINKLRGIVKQTIKKVYRATVKGVKNIVDVITPSARKEIPKYSDIDLRVAQSMHRSNPSKSVEEHLYLLLNTS